MVAMKTEIRGRYAPSPSGPLHAGNLRTALLSWLQVRLLNGTWILRIEDHDTARVKPGCEARLMQDLRWLGLDWDEGPDKPGDVGPYQQSKRTAVYKHYFNQLQFNNSIYPCYCSRRDIQLAASAPHGRTLVYPGTCRKAGLTQLTKRQSTSAWRFYVDQRQRDFYDEIAGIQHQDIAEEIGDFVVKRRDALFAYQLAVVVDDASMGVTDVLRGMDLLDSTPRQILLFQDLRLTVPRFWHVPLMSDTGGVRLSKRHDANSLAQLRATYKTAEQLVGFLAHSTGLIDRPESCSAAELLQQLDIETFRDRLQQHALAAWSKSPK